MMEEVVAVLAVVLDVQAGGAIKTFNETRASPMDKRVQAGDGIIEVNGLRGDPMEVIGAIRASNKLEMRLRRPSMWSMSVDLGHNALGLDVQACEDDAFLVVKGVRPGALKDKEV